MIINTTNTFATATVATFAHLDGTPCCGLDCTKCYVGRASSGTRICPRCLGSGNQAGSDKPCPRCLGEGIIGKATP